MSEQDNKESKTEQATEKKISDALEKGNVPHSREVVISTSILGTFVAMNFALETNTKDVVNFLSYVFGHADQIRLDTAENTKFVLATLTFNVFAAIWVSILLIFSFGVLGSVCQASPRASTTRISPDFGRVSLIAGLKRLFGTGAALEFFKTTIKICALFALLAYITLFAVSNISGLVAKGILELIRDTQTGLNRIVIILLVFCIGVSMIDIILVRRRWHNDLKMTTKEVRDELKESDGNPLLKSFRRSVALKRSRGRMLLSVPESTLIVCNPTHFSIALRYDRQKDSAPVVLAKGQDLLALKIREIAASADIPMIENKSLARALYRVVEVNQSIPVEFYQAVAELIIILQKTARLKSAL